MHKLLTLLSLICLTACSESTIPIRVDVTDAIEITMRHAKTFSVWERDGYRIVDLQAPIVTWGGAATGPEQRARIVLVPKNDVVPELIGDLAGATVIRTPVSRIAVNLAPFEAMLRVLDSADLLVAVGGVKSWDDDIRAKARNGKIAQIGYGWHIPPMLDSLLASRPDVFLMAMGDLAHAEQYQRILSLGIPVVPIFLDAEPHYMGDVDYVRLIGMLTGKEAEAENFVSMVENNVAELKELAATQSPVKMVSAFYTGGEAWMATQRNAENAFIEDANGINLLRQPDNNQLNSFSRVSTEEFLERGKEAECAILRDTHSVAYPDEELIRAFTAWKNGCVFASDGMAKPDADAFDFYETALIRPDWILGDMVRMLHPELRTAPFRYIRPDSRISE